MLENGSFAVMSLLKNTSKPTLTVLSLIGWLLSLIAWLLCSKSQQFSFQIQKFRTHNVELSHSVPHVLIVFGLFEISIGSIAFFPSLYPISNADIISYKRFLLLCILLTICFGKCTKKKQNQIRNSHFVFNWTTNALSTCVMQWQWQKKHRREREEKNVSELHLCTHSNIHISWICAWTCTRK